MERFAMLLQLYQERFPARRAVARKAGIDHARYNRLVRGEVAPADRDQVLAIAAALELDAVETDRLAVAAGYLPPSLALADVGDPALRAVLDVLHQQGVADADRDAFRALVTQAAQWLLAASGGAEHDPPA